MKKDWIDDPYDKRKRELLTGLKTAKLTRSLAVVPMATDAMDWSEEDYHRYIRNLGHTNAAILTKSLFSRTRSGNPGDYFNALGGIQTDVDLFIDPDSGLTPHRPGDHWHRWKEDAHIAVSEVIDIICGDQQRLVLVYDHAVDRRESAEAHAAARVNLFQKANVSAMAWFWNRSSNTDQSAIIAVSCSADRVSQIRLSQKSFGATGIA
jgi:hypothetical protein